MGALKLPTTVRITEVGPRDGLQNEQTPISTDDKVRFVELLADTGLPEIEVTSFVNPKWVPQLADAAEVMARIERRAGVVYSAPVPNQRGLERALAAAPIRSLCSPPRARRSASETLTQPSTRRWHDSSRSSGRRRAPGSRSCAYVSCIVACPYEGPVDPARVRAVTQRLLDLGVDEIDLGETLGVAAPTDIERVYDELDGLLEPADTVLHLHDTRGTALAVALRASISACGDLTPHALGWEAVLTRRARRATWPPRTWSTCAIEWDAVQASTCRGSSPPAGRSPRRLAQPNRPRVRCRRCCGGRLRQIVST